MIERIASSGGAASGAGRSAPGGAPAGMDRLKQSMRRFAGRWRSLPVDFPATCPTCRRVVPARFDRAAEKVVLTYDCDRCGRRREVHHDAIWAGTPGPVLRRLPRTVESLCPECCAIVIGRHFVEDGAVFIEKSCPEHGYFRDCVNSDVVLYSKAAWWSFSDRRGQMRPHVTGGANCPSDCGLCDRHLSAPCLAQINLTSRCNMRCSVCFADAGAPGNVFEPDHDEIVRQLRTLRDLRPTPCTAIQFTGGEPTIHPEFLRIVAAARRMGFSHIQIATNGLKLADADFAARCAEAGVHTIYLQFDGVGDRAHRRTRNFPGLWEKKLAAIANCRRYGMKICLVPTILKGVNDDRVAEIFRFAVANIDVVSGISFQPVSFSGRISSGALAERRYTLGDLAHAIADASGASPLRDMFPLSIVAPLSSLLEALTGETKISPTCHTDCAFGTYFLVSPEGRAYPFPEVIDVEGMFTQMDRIAARIRRRGHPTRLDVWRTFRMFRRHFNADAAPPGLTVKRFIRSIQGLVDKRLGRGEGEKQTYKSLLCAGMHFQDRYNYDVQRVQRCVILYSTPAGVFPFCTYNCGPEYRSFVERAYAAQADYAAHEQPEPDEVAAEKLS